MECIYIHHDKIAHMTLGQYENRTLPFDQTCFTECAPVNLINTEAIKMGSLQPTKNHQTVLACTSKGTILLESEISIYIRVKS